MTERREVVEEEADLVELEEMVREPDGRVMVMVVEDIFVGWFVGGLVG